MPARELLRRPDARAESVEDLVAKVLRGEVRIPVFQRGLKWDAKDVVDLFDSLYRGYPVGALLLRRAPAAAGPVQIGPVQVFGDESPHALWVVDGQQRLTSLAVGLGREGALPTRPVPTDPYAIYFDPVATTFHPPPTDGQLPSTWVPVPRLLSDRDLRHWIATEWAHGQDVALRAVVVEAGTRLRAYRVPLYVVDTTDDVVTRLIFDRVNFSGKRLTSADVFDALFAHQTGGATSLAELAEELARLGMGTPDEASLVLPSLVAMRGFDVTRAFSELARDHADAFVDITREAASVLRSVLAFLRIHAEVPHLQLLPSSAPLVVLARFFALHPEPNGRTTMLLVRWVWRTFCSPAIDDRALLRRGVEAISHDEEQSAQSLLALVDRQSHGGFQVPERFDPRTATTRLVLLGLASRGPRTLPSGSGDGQRLDVAATIQDCDREAFRAVFPGSDGELRSPGNRLLLPGPGTARALLAAAVVEHGAEHPFFASQLIAPEAAIALVNDDATSFVRHRTAAIAQAVDELADRLAAWGRNDRPSIEYLLQLGDRS